jgi:hypothetical protein
LATNLLKADAAAPEGRKVGRPERVSVSVALFAAAEGGSRPAAAAAADDGDEEEEVDVVYT